jgi:hypothetical protein
MTIIYGWPRPEPKDPIEHYRDRMRELLDHIDEVRCDQELAMYRAHQHGMSDEEIARYSGMDVTKIRETIEQMSRCDEVDEFDDGPSWVPRYPCW